MLVAICVTRSQDNAAQILLQVGSQNEHMPVGTMRQKDMAKRSPCMVVDKCRHLGDKMTRQKSPTLALGTNHRTHLGDKVTR